MNDYSPYGRDKVTTDITDVDARSVEAVLSSEPLGRYTCAICKEEWNSSVSEVEAAAEYARNFPEAAANNEPHEIVCNVCYKKHFGWAE